MTTYRFTLTVAGVPEIPDPMDEVTGRVLATGCDDATLTARGQTFFLGFDRAAESLGDAIGSAVKDVERAGYGVARIDVDRG